MSTSYKPSVKETNQFHSPLIFYLPYINEDDKKLFERSDINPLFEPKKYKTFRIKQAKRIYELYKASSLSKNMPFENIELRLIILQNNNEKQFANNILIYGFENGLIANNEADNKLHIQQRDKSENIAAIASSIIDGTFLFY